MRKVSRFNYYDTPSSIYIYLNLFCVICCISKTLEEYGKAMRRVEIGLARAVSKTLGFEEQFIEKELELKSGFDVMAMNLYPPNAQSNGAVGLSEHTDPGFIISLIQDINGGLQILSHKGNWINAYIPHHAILIQLGDQLEVLLFKFFSA